MIKFQRAIDRVIGSIFCTLLGPLTPKPREVGSPAKVAIIKLWAVGESVVTLPLIRAIHEAFPSAEITVIARERNKEIYTKNEYISKVLTLEKDPILKLKKRFDLVFDCEPYLNVSALIGWFIGKKTIGFSHGRRAKLYSHKVPYNDKQHVVKTYLDLLKAIAPEVKYPKTLVPIGYTREDLEQVEEKIQQKVGKLQTVIGICAGAAESAPSRIWSPDNFAKVADYFIKQYNAFIIFVGSPGERERNEQIITKMTEKRNVWNAAGETSLKQLTVLTEKCNLFISNDTGPMHISAAQSVPTIGLFCPNTPVRFGPYGSDNTAIYKPILSSPCINVHKGIVPDCTDHDHMANIHPNDVIAAAERILERRQNQKGKRN